MNVGIGIVIGFTLLVIIVLVSAYKPRPLKKISGRGGDFQE
jgi:hypothetical protein